MVGTEKKGSVFKIAILLGHSSGCTQFRYKIKTHNKTQDLQSTTTFQKVTSFYTGQKKAYRIELRQLHASRFTRHTSRFTHGERERGRRRSLVPRRNLIV